jgi:alkaline phosphatase
LRDLIIDTPGHYEVIARNGKQSMTVNWEVYSAANMKQKIILFIGDGMTVANLRTATRMLSKGIKEANIFGKLAFDDMPHMALISTSGVDSIITDSANSMHAYTTYLSSRTLSRLSEVA